jgi:hypothetical protein
METWMYGLIAIPVVAVGAAYAMGAFSTKTAEIQQNINQLQDESRQFEGDVEWNGPGRGGRRKKTKKSKSKHKKTKKHSK